MKQISLSSKRLVVKFATKNNGASRILKRSLVAANSISWDSRLYLGEAPYLDYAYVLVKDDSFCSFIGMHQDFRYLIWGGGW